MDGFSSIFYIKGFFAILLPTGNPAVSVRPLLPYNFHAQGFKFG